jgi:hypothetical protein
MAHVLVMAGAVDARFTAAKSDRSWLPSQNGFVLAAARFARDASAARPSGEGTKAADLAPRYQQGKGLETENAGDR